MTSVHHHRLAHNAKQLFSSTLLQEQQTKDVSPPVLLALFQTLAIRLLNVLLAQKTAAPAPLQLHLSVQLAPQATSSIQQTHNLQPATSPVLMASTQTQPLKLVWLVQTPTVLSAAQQEPAPNARQPSSSTPQAPAKLAQPAVQLVPAQASVRFALQDTFSTLSAQPAAPVSPV